MRLDLRVAEDPEALAAETADLVLEVLTAALEARPRARWVLSGGSTPDALYRRLAAVPDALDWSRVDFFWGDERCVDPQDGASNYRAASEALLDPLRIDPTHRFRIRGESAPSVAVERYGTQVDAALRDGDWDLVLLGLGEDGHTASLFPPRAGAEESGWAVVTEAPSSPRVRISMTLEALTRARRALFLVSGASKATALARVLDGDPALHASALAASSPRVTWCIDRAASSELAPTVQSGRQHAAVATRPPEEL